jgi:hypothetical protein
LSSSSRNSSPSSSLEPSTEMIPWFGLATSRSSESIPCESAAGRMTISAISRTRRANLCSSSIHASSPRVIPYFRLDRIHVGSCRACFVTVHFVTVQGGPEAQGFKVG